MAAVEVLNLEGQRVGEIELNDAVFGAPIKEHLLWEVVTAQRAGWRSGTACTKTRSEVRGSTRKIFRQKGSGRGRHGSIRASIFVGGGQVFSPKPRSYAQRVPKKVRRGALISALSLRASEKKLLVLQDLTLGEIKTKKMVGILGKLGVTSGLIIEDKANVELIKSVHNLPHTKWLAPEGLNVYDLLRYPSLVITAPVIKQIEERLLK